MTVRFQAPRAAALALALALAAASSPGLADTLIDRVEGMTIDEEGKLIRFTGLVIDEEGKVRELVRRGESKPEAVDYRIDGKGRVMIPGLIDSHAHVSSVGIAALTLDLSHTRSLDEALEAIRRFAADNPGRPWILGRGWNQEKWGLGRFPTAAELDAVVPDRPVWLGRVDGHAGWANSLAIEAAGIDAKTKDPEGGRIIRNSDGSPQGVFVDAAQQLVTRVVPPPRPSERDLALRKAQEIFLERGITAVADMGTSIEDWHSFRRTGDLGALKIRIIAYADHPDTMELIGGAGPTPWLYRDHLRLNGLKIYVDGALGSRGALLKQPYADDPHNRGLALIAPAKLRNQMSRAAMHGFQTAIHAIGDEANAEVLEAIEELSAAYEGDRRWRIEHAQIVDPADIEKFGRFSIIASMQPVHQTSDRLMAEARLGPDRLDGAYAWRSILAAGARLAFGSDAPVEDPDPFAGLAAAISRMDENGEPFGGWLPQETITREQALAAYSADGAYAAFAEGRFGRLLPGEWADFVLIDKDPMLASPDEIRATRVIETWVGGERVFSRKED